MPRKLSKITISEVSTVTRGAGEGCVIALRKADEAHVFNIVVRKDAEGRGTLRLDDIRDMAKYFGVKPKKLLKLLNAPPKAEPEPQPAPPVLKVVPPMPKPEPPPVKESFYTSLCKYAATKARPDETTEQAFARVATTDPLGRDLMVATKVADVTSDRANFWQKPLPKEPDKAVVEPNALHTYDNLSTEVTAYAQRIT
jgi:hypothetical protein